MKGWRLLVFALFTAILWSGAAHADLFYNVVFEGSTKYGTITGEDYDVNPDLRGNVGSYALALSFTDNRGRQWAVVDEYSSGSGAPNDTVDIYDPYGSWSRPAYELNNWGRNIQGLAVKGRYLYIVALERYEGGVQLSGEIIRVDMDNSFTPDKRYKFDANTSAGEPILRKSTAIKIIGEKIYALTYTYDGEHSIYAGFGPSEIFEFDEDLNPTRSGIIGAGDDSAKNATFLAEYDGKLYAGSSGGALGDSGSAGAVWEIDTNTLTSRKAVDLGEALSGNPMFTDKNKGMSGLEITKNGTVYLLAGGYDTSFAFDAQLYTTSVNNLTAGNLGSAAPRFTSSGYSWGILFDETLGKLWCMAGNELQARDGDDVSIVEKSFTENDLGGPIYKIAVISAGESPDNPDGPNGNGGDDDDDDDGSGDAGGGGCSAGFAMIPLLLAASASLLKFRVK
jgi:hypothetical protein